MEQRMSKDRFLECLRVSIPGTPCSHRVSVQRAVNAWYRSPFWPASPFLDDFRH